jgi:hypothetical protein
MQKIPEAVRKHLNESLLGRLKLLLFKKISGTSDQMPEGEQVRLFLIDESRQNLHVANLFGALINHNHSQSIEYPFLPETSNIVDVLHKLEMNPLDEPFFLEITDCPDPWPTSIGALASWEELSPCGYVYVITLFEDHLFPDQFLGRAEVRASQKAPEPAISVRRLDGWEPFTQQNYKLDSLALLIAQIMTVIEQKRHKKFIPLSEVSTSHFEAQQNTIPPDDAHFELLFRLVIAGKLLCTEAEIELAFIKPHDINFALAFPSDIIDQSIPLQQIGLSNHLLIYWHNDVFVMSDSYPIYLAYRKLSYKKVPVIIMGPYPEGLITPIRTGGKELIPPFQVAYPDDDTSLPDDLKEYILSRRLNKKPLSEPLSRIYRLFIELAQLVSDPLTKEKELHALLLENPMALDAFGLCIRTEVKLGSKYRVDLLMQYEYTDKRILLIELERADHSIFNKKGRLRAEVVHAIQQVEDWIQWWRENPHDIPNGLDKFLPVEGLVIIGRSAKMNDAGKRRLLSLNSSRKVQVITYDDLLDRIRNLIVNLEKLQDSS